MTFQDRIDELTKLALGGPLCADLYNRLRELPVPVQEIAREFPPFCVVMAVRPTILPGPAGALGLVESYQEPSKEYPQGWIGVSSLDRRILWPPPGTLGWCHPGWLQVVGYTQNICPEDVDRELGVGGPEGAN